MNTRIPTRLEYEARERADLMALLRDVERAPLVDKLEALGEWAEALVTESIRRDGGRNLVAERVGWLLDGSYGWGAMERALAIAVNTRCNREAMLGRLVAAIEWRCPGGFAGEAWLGLTPEQQRAVNTAILAEIEYAVKEREEGR